MAEVRISAPLWICLLLGSLVASDAQSELSSFAGEYGPGGGTAFTFASEQTKGPISGLRVREDDIHLTGIQLRYGNHWGPYYGNLHGTLHEILLRPREAITQVSGKYGDDITELIFVTNRCRLFKFGHSSGTSFNDFPKYDGAVLRYITGIYTPPMFYIRIGPPSGLRSIGFHWDSQHLDGDVGVNHTEANHSQASRTAV